MRQNPMDEIDFWPENLAPSHPIPQGRPTEFPNLAAEMICILLCSFGQLLWTVVYQQVAVNQLLLLEALDLTSSLTAWLIGSNMLASGLSVVIAGSLADLIPPKGLVVGAFAWLAAWSIPGVFSISPSRKALFFITRAMYGLAIGVLASGSISILGRTYKPGKRKVRVFSFMAAFAPLGALVGALQGAAFSDHLEWIFGSTGIFCALCAIAAIFTIPSFQPSRENSSSDPPSIRDFDCLGAILGVCGNFCILFGVTQGASTEWSPYTYSLTIVGGVIIAAFCLVERRARRPLVPPQLWAIPGFGALVIAYFLGFGAFVSAWALYAIQFWLRIQQASPLRAALYLTPNAVVGVLSTWIVSRTLHIFPNHWILTTSMIAYALGPVFFIPQTPHTIYWALSMPGVALVTFGPDLSFAAIAVFITSSVPRSYQGSAGSLIVTVQNLSSAIIAALAGTIGAKVDGSKSTGEVGVTLQGMRAIWWFGFAISLVGALITATMVRISKEEEREHVEMEST